MSEHLYKVIFDVLPHAVLALDEELKIVMYNQGCESLLSKSGEEIEGKKIFEVIPHEYLQNQARIVLQNREAGTNYSNSI